MKKLLLVALFVLTCAVALPRLSAQSAMFTYTGVPTGPVECQAQASRSASTSSLPPGEVLLISQGLSYWFAQLSPAGGPYPFAITNRDVIQSPFNMVGNLVYPQPLAPVTPSDLGGLTGNGLPPGTYFVANLTFSVASNSVPGIYTLGNSTSSIPMVGGRISVIDDNNGNTFPIAASNFDIMIIPEPSSFALMAVGAVGAGLAAYGRRMRRR